MEKLLKNSIEIAKKFNKLDVERENQKLLDALPQFQANWSAIAAQEVEKHQEMQTDAGGGIGF